MRCTGGCGRLSRHEDRTSLEAEGWFMWSSAAHVRFHGVVLCPECRMRAENEDSYGRLWPTAELEEMASLAVVTKSAGGSSRCTAEVDGGRCAGLAGHEGEHYANARDRAGGSSEPGGER